MGIAFFAMNSTILSETAQNLTETKSTEIKKRWWYGDPHRTERTKPPHNNRIFKQGVLCELPSIF